MLVIKRLGAHDTGVDDFKQKSSKAKLNATEAPQEIIDEAVMVWLPAASPKDSTETCAR